MSTRIPSIASRAALLLLLTFIAACTPAEPTSTPTPSPTPPPSAETILAASGESMAALDSFRFRLSHENGGTPLAIGLVVTDVEGDVVKPDGLSLSLGATFSGFFVELHLIAVDGVTYMTDPVTQAWEIQEAGVNPLAFFDPATGIDSIMSDMTDASLAGQVTLDGVTTHHISGKLPSDSLVPLLSTVTPDLTVDTEVWIGEDDSYLRKVVFRGVAVAGDAENIVRTIALSNFNQAEDIEAPPLN
ncbi:MAG: LppX_LprAFG lipoprotein [Chloroflexota bacterium]|nr:LppX_LprAFG lipoprotein [Chloroflexota bacterium]MDE2941101.1 LppX_LprAFG lipoprotein [Chloroflexota bacterium]MDE3267373.1 LppX_LprAFG lipoprotein [Chloroflexota bacterium]